MRFSILQPDSLTTLVRPPLGTAAAAQLSPDQSHLREAPQRPNRVVIGLHKGSASGDATWLRRSHYGLDRHKLA